MKLRMNWPALLRWRQHPLAGLGVLTLVAVTLAWVNRPDDGLAGDFDTYEDLPDFSDYASSANKKAAFFDYILPQISEVNAHILADRQRLLSIRAKLADGGSGGWGAAGVVEELAEDYEIDEVPDPLTVAFLDRLLRRVDVIAPSLVLAQAAKESGWGSSRFARQGNNLFGMRCHRPGCGIVPKRRPAGATWEVASYPSVLHAIDAYVHTLNTGSSYRGLRDTRVRLRTRKAAITGPALANGLHAYSERGHSYIADIRDMIASNNLTVHDS